VTEYSTLIKKSCGHCGLIRNKFLQKTISCSQCEFEENDFEKALVRVMKRKFMLLKELPDYEFEKMEQWIRERLEEE
jgi:hypothetical protein